MKKLLALTALTMIAACGPKQESAPADASPAAASPAGETTVADAAAPAPAATPADRGKRQFNECAVCHTVKAGEGHRVGPNLHDVLGRTAGTIEGFAFSRAMQDSGVIWTDETLSAYLENPQGFMPGNRMAYAGLKDPNKRADVIAYIQSLKTE